MEKSNTVRNPMKESVIIDQRVDYDLYVGLDVHKATIAIAIALPGREPARYRSEVTNSTTSVKGLVERIQKEYSTSSILFCYEAGPCGYVLYHQLHDLHCDCIVVAPSLIPRKAGDRIKTDRRDAVKLAASLRSGDLTSVRVPQEDQESMRDLTRARNDMKSQERAARQQLNAFVLRHGFHWPANKQRWNQGHYNWLESLVFNHPWQQIVLQEYIDTVKAATGRVEEITKQMMSEIN